LTVNATKRFLLLLLMLALPVQGALAASRLCMGMAHPLPAAAAGVQAHEGYGVRSAHDHHPAAHAPQEPDATYAAAVPPADVPPMLGASHDHVPLSDHVSGTCSQCAACCLTVAVAPPAPSLQLTAAGDATYRTILVPVPHNVADGLERPPRTI
jgi:hypothetical protein